MGTAAPRGYAARTMRNMPISFKKIGGGSGNRRSRWMRPSVTLDDPAWPSFTLESSRLQPAPRPSLALRGPGWDWHLSKPVQRRGSIDVSPGEDFRVHLHSRHLARECASRPSGTQLLPFHQGLRGKGDVMRRERIQQACACPCGASRFDVSGRPLVRLLCHCTICQAFNRQPYADVTAFWAGSITLRIGHQIEFKRYRPPPAARRGHCRSCSAPVVEFLAITEARRDRPTSA